MDVDELGEVEEVDRVVGTLAEADIDDVVDTVIVLDEEMKVGIAEAEAELIELG